MKESNVQKHVTLYFFSNETEESENLEKSRNNNKIFKDIIIKYEDYVSMVDGIDDHLLMQGIDRSMKWIQREILRHYTKKHEQVVFENRWGDKQAFFRRSDKNSQSLQEREFCRFMNE